MGIEIQITEMMKKIEIDRKNKERWEEKCTQRERERTDTERRRGSDCDTVYMRSSSRT